MYAISISWKNDLLEIPKSFFILLNNIFSLCFLLLYFTYLLCNSMFNKNRSAGLAKIKLDTFAITNSYVATKKVLAITGIPFVSLPNSGLPNQ